MFKSVVDPHQRMNNMPAIKYIVGYLYFLFRVLLIRKDFLQKRMALAKAEYGEQAFSFWPKGFSLDIPAQYEEFRKIFLKPDPNKPPPIYIIKRPALVRHLGP